MPASVDLELGGQGKVVVFGATGNIGQRFGFTRIGESFLTRFSVSVDEGRDNVGVNLSFEPRFLGGPASGRVAGTVIMSVTP